MTAIIPYYGYAGRDRKTAPQVPISASDVAMMLEDGGSRSRDRSRFTEVVVTDTIPHDTRTFPDNITRLSVAPLLAEVVFRLHNDLPLDEQFNK